MARIVRTQEQIDEVIDLAVKQKDEGGSKYPGMSFEDGVLEMHDWLTGLQADSPMWEEE